MGHSGDEDAATIKFSVLGPNERARKMDGRAQSPAFAAVAGKMGEPDELIASPNSARANKFHFRDTAATQKADPARPNCWSARAADGGAEDPGCVRAPATLCCPQPDLKLWGDVCVYAPRLESARNPSPCARDNHQP